MELNREQVKKELVLFIDDTPVELHFNHKKTSKFLSFLKLVLAVITTDEQKIFELENRLKECENGYEGTLYLERCKLHDAEQKTKELTEENAELRREYDSMAKSVNEASELIRSLKSRIRRLEAYDEQRDIALHKRLIDETRVDTTSKIFEEIINALKYTTFASPLEKNGTLDYIYSLREKYIKDVK